MKKLIILFAVTFLSFGLFAQKAHIEGSAENFKKNVESGDIKVEMPEKSDADEINRSSKYYVDYFTVDYNEETRIADIKMVDNTSESRRVINRFFLSNNVRIVELDGEEYSINEFYSSFLE
ncbi:MAG: hypothetical protein WED10_02995 [Brumimicrobium sp.]